MPHYRPVLFDQAAIFIVALPRRRQRQALETVARMARHPFVPSDFSTTDADGRIIEHLLVEKFAVSYWVDHAARLVMITEIEFAD
jgi:hypothetical protein